MLEKRGIYCNFDIHIAKEEETENNNITAYMVYTVWKPKSLPNQLTHIRVEKLTSDYLSSTKEASAIFTPPSGKLHPGGADEAPSMFIEMDIITSCLVMVVAFARVEVVLMSLQQRH